MRIKCGKCGYIKTLGNGSVPERSRCPPVSKGGCGSNHRDWSIVPEPVPPVPKSVPSVPHVTPKTLHTVPRTVPSVPKQKKVTGYELICERTIHRYRKFRFAWYCDPNVEYKIKIYRRKKR